VPGLGEGGGHTQGAGCKEVAWMIGTQFVSVVSFVKQQQKKQLLNMNAKNKMPNLKFLQVLCRIGLKPKHFRLFLSIVLKDKISRHLLLQRFFLQ
jgi:NAD dependent epimerase/dehydratase family enzyme